MSSKQINFYKSQVDISEINNFLKSEGCHIIKSQVIDPAIIFDYDILKNEENIFQVYLYREDFRNMLEFTCLDSNKYYVDIVKSYTIEFSLGGFYPYSGKELHQSRFYYVFEYYGKDDMIIKKSREFNSWANNILESFKVKFLKKSSLYPKLFFTQNCLSWIDKNKPILKNGGGKFVIE
ncbi:MAG TPA: hypothetical protein VD794_10865, partial [Flavisolibacter sp.]|nr:hypothetical protein [Flavisolibacter sp.]